jgi:hypothetical protein
MLMLNHDDLSVNLQLSMTTGGRMLSGQKDFQMSEKVEWIASDQNRWGLRVLDCRRFVAGLEATTSDLNTAMTFARNRHLDGRDLTYSHPSQGRSVLCGLRYQIREKPHQGALFVAQTMEDKWDIFCNGDSLYFCRSWTGSLVLLAHVEFTRDLIVREIEYDGTVSIYDDVLAMRHVDFLVRTYLLGEEVPAPLPAAPGSSMEQICLLAFNLFGRRATFATFDDTLQSNVH